MTDERTLLIPSTPGDRFFDYCLEIYEPRCDPADKLRGESLLWHSLEVAGLPRRDDAIFHAIQRAAGRDMTVFGVKWFGGELSWELYFYDPQREDTQITAAALREALVGSLDIAVHVPDAIRYFMYSFDLSAASLARARVDELNVYLQFHEGQGGHSYAVREGACELRNTYRFHRPKLEIDAILHQVQRSLYVDFTRTQLAEIVIPELFECQKICVAKKRFADAIYYSGITVDQLLWFFRRFAYPAEVQAFVERERGRFEHLLFDVGIDYHTGPDGRLVYDKTGYYSTL
ncbi:hypothetical protein DB30_05565 [Enhygromyxa salina]|uniref:Uncharacterized protein n=1 Tax=Enhygromyxa salina TaxID=215803 RepID=A0A0C1ZWL7_9BACT|nr:hypothetical protein [Enhygromyxa salina]KIG15448.1 hypothetical protein DB30_05565 [Enhygromyxa salina]